MEQKIGERIKDFRIDKNILQKDLAVTIGVTPATLARYEKDKIEPSLEMIDRIAKALELTSEELMFGFSPSESAVSNARYANITDEETEHEMNLQDEVYKEEIKNQNEKKNLIENKTINKKIEELMGIIIEKDQKIQELMETLVEKEREISELKLKMIKLKH